MSLISSFGSFTAVRLGVYAAQKGLSVTGNNISNINTVGYTRQRVDQSSLKTGGADAYASKYDARTGQGVLVTGLSQIRDPYLDIRFRNEWSSVGYTDHKLAGLQDIAAVLDETGKGVNEDGLIFAALSDFKSSLEQMSTDTSAESNDTLARASADTLTALFRKYADDLEGLRTDTINKLKEEVQTVNTMLSKIRELSEAIRKSDIHGDPALELRDDRNNYIDELSEYLKIDVVYTMEDIGAGQQVEHLTIRLANANPDPSVTTDSTVLVDGIYARQLSMPDSFPTENEDYDPDYEPADPDNIDPTVDIKAFKYVKTDENGNLVGTNDASEADQIENSNFDMFLSKLLDGKGNEWNHVLSSSVKALNPNDDALTDAPAKAVYSITIDPDGFGFDEDNPTINIQGTTYRLSQTTIGSDTKLASFIAGKLKDDDYDISADGNKIVFTAKKAGAVPGDGAANTPNYTLTDSNNGNVALPLTEEVPGKNAGTGFQYSSVATNDDGSKTITSLTLRDSTWYKTEIVCEYSQEVALDDNDLYGGLQADRELLTEAGEFATTDAINNIDENAAIKRGLPYYQKCLDLLARTFAETFNKANTGYAVDQDGNYLDPDGNVLTLDGEPVTQGTELTTDQQTALNARALTDFVKLNVTGMEADGTLLGLDGEPLTLGGQTLNAHNLSLNADPNNNISGISLGDKLAGVTGVDDDGNFVDEDGNILLEYDKIESITTITNADLSFDQQVALDEQALDNFLAMEGDLMGGNLFSCRGDLDDGEGITAANITISHSWSTGAVHIVNSFTKLFGGEIQDTTQNKNVDHMITLMDAAQLYDPQHLVADADSDHLFEGSFHEMMVKICSVLGNDQSMLGTELDTHYAYAIEMDTSRDSVSAVDLNDEAMNMMMYSKALSAAYRLMTVIDESLERLINGTAV